MHLPTRGRITFTLNIYKNLFYRNDKCRFPASVQCMTKRKAVYKTGKSTTFLKKHFGPLKGTIKPEHTFTCQAAGTERVNDKIFH
ncbi:hypothetical protein GDO81_015554 [Engystomops pustulosus]|uniref:Uncharacterized protein n=1 Tax=Engystomops pustulosus TaxID=76066 RepID=A0AAV7AKC4_ENGPU|nr:hypothetical protein GDO81_015554 [Engystomops pustulosus]